MTLGEKAVEFSAEDPQKTAQDLTDLLTGIEDHAFDAGKRSEYWRGWEHGRNSKGV